MQQALRIALVLTLAVPSLARGMREGDGLAQARALVARGEHQKAAALLEEELPRVGGRDRVAVLELLRQTYRTLIAQAEASGKKAQADSYRDDLAILDPAEEGGQEPPPSAPVPPAHRQESPGPAPSPAPATPAPATPSLRPLPRTEPSAEAAPVPEPSPLPDPGPLPPLSGPAPAPAAGTEEKAAGAEPSLIDRESRQASTEGSAPEESSPPASPSPLPGAAPAPGPPGPASPTSDLARADQLFNAKKYEEAGRIYARLAANNQLPAGRRQVWAYCRWVSVVARINAPPRDSREWDAIEQEIRSIQRLTPGNWYGEYLRNRVAEARRGSKSTGRAGRLVVRGSEPDEPAPRRIPRLLGRNRAADRTDDETAASAGSQEPLRLPSAGGDDPAPAPRPGPADREKPADQAPVSGGETAAEPQHLADPAVPPAASLSAPARAPAPLPWQVRESANFRIYHMDPLLAEKAAAAAEAARSQQARRWGSTATRSTWKPACEIYLYPSSRDFAEMTGQPETSPGFSTLGLNASQVTARRISLRADHPQVLTAILPHEVTHVVLADLFTDQQIPRWADEGMAVLAEPLAEQINRSADLIGPLADGQVFKLSELMAIDFPNADAWNTYYAQSVSLTQFLVEQATPEQFIRFVRAAQRGGVEAALRDVYRINGFADLENRWLKYARRQVAEIASSRDAARGSDTTRR